MNPVSKEKRSAQNKAYYQKHRDRLITIYAERAAQRKASRDSRANTPNSDIVKRRLRMYGTCGTALLEQQQGGCAICKQQVSLDTAPVVEKAVIDHCHSTNKVRGILCGHCNKGLGFFKDNPVALQAAIEYLNINH